MRSGRWAMVFDKDGKVIYADHEKGPGEVTVSYNGFDSISGGCANVWMQVSGAEAVLAKL